MSEMAGFIRESLRELFQRLEGLESKVNRIIVKANCQLVKRGEILNGNSPNVCSDSHIVAMLGSNKTQIETSQEEVTVPAENCI